MPARSAPSGERRSTFGRRSARYRSRARRPRASAGTAPARCPPRRRCRGSRPRDRQVDRPEAVAAGGWRRRAAPLARLAARAGPGTRARAGGRSSARRGLLGHAVGVEGALADAVTEHRHPVGDAEHLGQPVADVDDADAGRRARRRARAAARPPPARAPSSARRAGAPSAGRAAPSRPRASAARRATAPVGRGSRPRSYSASVAAAQSAICPYDGRRRGGAARYRFSATESSSTSENVW